MLENREPGLYDGVNDPPVHDLQAESDKKLILTIIPTSHHGDYLHLLVRQTSTSMRESINVFFNKIGHERKLLGAT